MPGNRFNSHARASRGWTTRRAVVISAILPMTFALGLGLRQIAKRNAAQNLDVRELRIIGDEKAVDFVKQYAPERNEEMTFYKHSLCCACFPDARYSPRRTCSNASQICPGTILAQRSYRYVGSGLKDNTKPVAVTIGGATSPSCCVENAWIKSLFLDVHVEPSRIPKEEK